MCPIDLNMPVAAQMKWWFTLLFSCCGTRSSPRRVLPARCRPCSGSRAARAGWIPCWHLKMLRLAPCRGPTGLQPSPVAQRRGVCRRLNYQQKTLCPVAAFIWGFHLFVGKLKSPRLASKPGEGWFSLEPGVSLTCSAGWDFQAGSEEHWRRIQK